MNPGLGDAVGRADLTSERAASKVWPSQDMRKPMTTAGARETPALQCTNTTPFWEKWRKKVGLCVITEVQKKSASTVSNFAICDLT